MSMEGGPRMPSEDTTEGGEMTPENLNLDNAERAEPDLGGAAEQILEKEGETGIEIPVVSVGDEAQEETGNVLEGEALENALKEELHKDDARFEENVQREIDEFSARRANEEKYVLHQENGTRVWRKNNGNSSVPTQENIPDAQGESKELIDESAFQEAKDRVYASIDANAEKAQEEIHDMAANARAELGIENKQQQAEGAEESLGTPEGMEKDPGSLAGALKETVENIVREKQERIDKALSPEQIASPEYAKTLLEHELKLLNIDPEALAKDESLKDFNSLSDGQKLLVAQNLKQFAFSQANRDARSEFEKKVSEGGFTKRVGLNVFKGYNMAVLKKEHVKKAMSGGLGLHGGTLKQLTERAKAGPEIEIDATGELNVQYAAHFEKLSDEEAQQVKYFNKVAGDFSRIPEEWNPLSKTATKEQKDTYQEAEERYNEARKDVLNLKAKESSPKDAMLYMNGIDALVKQDQFLNTIEGQKLEEAMISTRDKSALWQGAKNVITERLGYMAFGAGTRVLTVGALTVAAGPVIGAAAPLIGAVGASAIVGAVLAGRRTKGAQREKAIARRYGEGASTDFDEVFEGDKKKIAALRTQLENEKDPERKTLLTGQYAQAAADLGAKRTASLESRYLERGLTVSAEALADKLLLTTLQFENEEDPKKRAKALASLRARIGYTQDKIDKGEINYGGSQDQLNNQFNLIQYLSRAQVYSAFEDPQVKKEVEHKLDRLAGYQEVLHNRTTQAEKRQVRKAGTRGALYAAVAATAGYGIMHYGMTRWGWFKADEVAEVSKGETGSSAVSPGGEQLPSVEMGSRVYVVSRGNNLWNMIEHDLKGELSGVKGHERDVIINNALNKFRDLSPEELKSIGFKFPEGETDVEKILSTIHPNDRIDFGKVFNSADINTALGRLHTPAFENEAAQIPSTIKPSTGVEDAPSSSGGAEASAAATPSSPRVIASEPRGNGSIFNPENIEKYRTGGGRFEHAAYTSGSPKNIADIPATEFERGVIFSELNGDINVLVPGGVRGVNWLEVRGESVERLMNTHVQLPRIQQSAPAQSPWGVRGNVHIGFGKQAHSNYSSIRIEHHPVPPPRPFRGPLPVGFRSPETVGNLKSYISALQEQTGLKWKGSGYSVEEYIFNANKVSGRINNIPGFGDNPIPDAGSLRGQSAAEGVTIRAKEYAPEDLTPSPFSKLNHVDIDKILSSPVNEEEGKEIMKNVAEEVNKIFQTNGAPKNGFDYGEGIGNMSADWEDLKSRTLDEILRAPVPAKGADGVGLGSYKALVNVRAELLPKLEYESGLPANGATTLEDYIRDAHVLIKRGPEFKPE